MTIRRKLVCLALFVALPVLAARSCLGQPSEGPPPEVVTLATKDGVQLKATYFPSPARKRQRPGEASDARRPAARLQGYARRVHSARSETPSAGRRATIHHSPSFAVDLRAHGESTKQLSPAGAQADLDAAKLSKEGLLAMASLDMEAVRNFLVDKNDAGELNLNKLCLVGSGMGASVAANWAVQDWTAPPLAVGKQGQDVKAIVLISPRWSFNGLSMQDPMKFEPLKQNVAWLLICGRKTRRSKPISPASKSNSNDSIRQPKSPARNAAADYKLSICHPACKAIRSSANRATRSTTRS